LESVDDTAIIFNYINANYNITIYILGIAWLDKIEMTYCNFSTRRTNSKWGNLTNVYSSTTPASMLLRTISIGHTNSKSCGNLQEGGRLLLVTYTLTVQQKHALTGEKATFVMAPTPNTIVMVPPEQLRVSPPAYMTVITR
jgi:hypothetical protein